MESNLEWSSVNIKMLMRAWTLSLIWRTKKNPGFLWTLYNSILVMRSHRLYGHFRPKVNQNLTQKVKIKEPVSLLIFNEIIEVIHTKHKTKAMKIIRLSFVVDFPHFLTKNVGMLLSVFWTDITSQQVSACKVMAMNFNKIGHAFASAM